MKLKNVLFAASAVVIVGCGPMTPTEDSGTGGGGGGSVTGGGGGSVTGGGGGATGGGGGGGGDVDAGTDAGVDAGVVVDAGVDCMTVTLDPKVGDLVLRNGAMAGQAATLPTGVSSIGVINNVLFGVGSDKQFHQLGALPTLTLGPALGSVVNPADADAGASVYLGGSLATTGTQLLAGYTKTGATFPGSVAVYDTADAGLRHVDAPANYTAVGYQGSFFINGGGLGTASNANIYVLDAQAPFGFATFDNAWMASSGYTAATANGVLLLGYFDGTDFQNHVRAAPPSLYASALTNRTSFALASAADLIAAGDLMDLTTVGNDAVVVHGGYDSSFELFTTSVERVPLTLAGSGTQTVTAAAPVKILEATSQCTKVNFVVGNGSAVLVGLQDRNGRRVVSIQP